MFGCLPTYLPLFRQILNNKPMIRTTIIFLIALIISSLSIAQSRTGSVRGKVNNDSGDALASVSIRVKGTTSGATSDQQGRYEISGIPPGAHTLEFSYIGFKTEQIQIMIVAGEILEVTEVGLKETAEELSTVTVTGAREKYVADSPSSSLRLNSPLIETPQNIQLITPAMLADQQVISMSDGVVRNVSGTVRTEHWGDLYANIKSRGSQLQAFRNGFNVVNSYWGPLTEDMSFVDHIEFVKGPAGFMLANGDPGGLYNVVTKKPTGVTKGEVSFTLGSFDLYRTALDLDGRLDKNKKLLYRLNVSGQNRKSHRPNEYNNRYVIAPVISYQLDDKTKLTAEYTWQKADMSDVGSFYVFSSDGFATQPVGATPLPAAMPGTKINDHSLYINLQHHLNDDWKVTGQVARFIYRQQGSSLWPSTVNPDGTMIRAVSSWEAESDMSMAQAFVNGRATFGSVEHRILGGLDMANKQYFADWGQYHVLDTEENPFDTNNPDYGTPPNGYPEFDFSTPLKERALAAGGTIDQRYTGVYLQDEMAFWNNRIRLTLAGRYTWLKQSEYGGDPIEAKHFTPRAGISATVAKETSIYGLYDQAFIPQSGRLANGDDVQPVTGNNIEFGVKRNWFDGKWNSTISAYRILKNNEITSDPNSPPASGLSIELGQKRAQGVEFDLRGTIAPGLSAVMNYAYTDSRVTRVAEGITDINEGDIIPGYAKHTANSWLTYKIQKGVLKGTGIAGGFTWLAGRETYWNPSPDPEQVLADYFKIDAGLFWENERLRITANVFNVLDEYLYSGSYYSWLNAYYWQTEAPRNVRLSLGYTF